MANTARKIDTTMQPGIVNDLPLDLIDFDPEQPRKDIDEPYIKELAADISTHGVLQPITVRPNPAMAGRYFVVYGENRTRASRVAGKFTIPAILASAEEIADSLTLLLDWVREQLLEKCHSYDLLTQLILTSIALGDEGYEHWEGNEIISASGEGEYAATSISKLNGRAVDFTRT